MPKPRKPVLAMRIEGLSNGVDPNARDDFTNEPLALPTKAIAKGYELKHKQEAARDAKRRLALQGLPQHVLPEYAKPKPVLRPAHKPGMRPIATLAGNALYVPNKPWRRI